MTAALNEEPDASGSRLSGRKPAGPHSPKTGAGRPSERANSGHGSPASSISSRYAPLPSRAEIDAAPASFEAIADLSRQTGTFGVYAFTVEEAAGGMAVWSRCFAPIAGLDEDPVTGSASGGLGCYLWRAGLLSPDGGRLTARQGFAGGRGGEVEIEIGAVGGIAARVAVTGTATLLAEGAFTLP